VARNQRNSHHFSPPPPSRFTAIAFAWGAAWLAGILAVSLPASALASWASFGNPACTDPKDQVNARAVSDGAGGMIVTWEDYRSDTADIFAQHFDNSGNRLWGTNGIAISTAPNYQLSPVLCSDGAGGAVIAWQDLRNGSDYDIYAQAVASNGTLKWSPSNGVAICTATNNQVLQVIASDGAGGAILGWQDSRSGVDADVYAQRVSSTGTPLWTPNGVGVCVVSGQQNEIRITPDQLGGAYIAWRDPRNGNMNNDIYAQSLDPNGNARWTTNGIPVCNASQNQFEPSISGDGRFGLLVSWTDMRNGTSDKIFAQRIKPDGTARWTLNGVQVCNAINDQRASQIVPDGFGGAIVGWTDGRVNNSVPDIFAQRVDSTGTNAWSPLSTGVSICSADSSQFLQTMIPDGAGGAILGWDDGRGAANNDDLYAQRISLAGTVRWTTDGVRFATGASTRSLTSSAPDGYGGALFAWQDYRNGPAADVFGLRMTSIGTGVETQGSPRVSAGTLLAKPNPFNPETVIEFTLKAPSSFDLSILDVQGRLVRTLASGNGSAGTHAVAWNGMGQNGTPSASGAYFAVLSTPTERRSTALRLIR